MDIDLLLQKKEFDSLDERQKQSLRFLAAETNGKSPMEAMPSIAKQLQTFKSGKELTPQERDAIAAVILENMPEAERLKFHTLMAMVNQQHQR